MFQIIFAVFFVLIVFEFASIVVKFIWIIWLFSFLFHLGKIVFIPGFDGRESSIRFDFFSKNFIFWFSFVKIVIAYLFAVDVNIELFEVIKDLRVTEGFLGEEIVFFIIFEFIFHDFSFSFLLLVYFKGYCSYFVLKFLDSFNFLFYFLHFLFISFV